MKPPLIPCFLLVGMLALCLANSAQLTRRCSDWDRQLEDIDARCVAEDWSAARRQLDTLYGDWQAAQGWLHMVLDHDQLNAAQALFRRATVLAQEEDSVEFRAHVADLRSQLMLLAEMEQPRPENIL